MSRKIHQAPFAVASDGTVLINVLELDAQEALEDLIKRAATQSGATFIGVTLSPVEIAKALDELADNYREVAASRAGPRIRRRAR